LINIIFPEFLDINKATITFCNNQNGNKGLSVLANFLYLRLANGEALAPHPSSEPVRASGKERMEEM